MVIKSGGKVLILSGRFGEGHLQAARAIQEAARLEYPQVETKIIDFMEWAHPNLYPVSHYVYMKGIKAFPQVYGFIYQKTYKGNSFSKKLNAALSGGMRKMLELLTVERPSVVISTYPFASSVLSKLKAEGVTNVPLVTVITDHTQHSYWLHPHTDQYLVGSAETRKKLIRIGIPAASVAVTGIPIRTKFLEEKDRQSLVWKYGLQPDLPTILIMGGGDGLIGKGLLEPNVLERIPEPMQLLILYGHNVKLYEKLKTDLKGCSKHHIKLIGYIEHIDEIMAVSDIIITKAGGVTTSEAVAMKLPMLLYKPLPGQEQDNVQFLTEAGVAVQAETPGDLVQKLTNLLANKQMLEKMSENCRKVETNRSAFSVLEAAAPFLFERPFVSVQHSKWHRLTTFRQSRKTLIHGQ